MFTESLMNIISLELSPRITIGKQTRALSESVTEYLSHINYKECHFARGVVGGLVTDHAQYQNYSSDSLVKPILILILGKIYPIKTWAAKIYNRGF